MTLDKCKVFLRYLQKSPKNILKKFTIMYIIRLCRDSISYRFDEDTGIYCEDCWNNVRTVTADGREL